MAFCNYCGSKISDEAKVCPVCGKPVSAAAKKAAPKRVAKKKSPGPTIALFAACGLVIAAIAVVCVVGIAHYGSGSSADVVNDTDHVYRTVDLSVVEEEIGDYDDVDTVIFTDRNGDSFTTDSIENGLATVELAEGDYTYKVITKNGEKYTGTVTVPAISDETSAGKTGADAKSTVTVDATPIAVQPDSAAQAEQTPAAKEDSSAQAEQTPAQSTGETAESLPADNTATIDSEPAAVSGDQSAEGDEAGEENAVIPEFVHFSVEDREEETLGEGDASCTYDAQYPELTASSAADFPALDSALKKAADDIYDADVKAITDVIGDENFTAFDNTGSYWTRTVSVVRADSTLFSVRYSVEYYFNGAAHGYAYSETFNYDPQTGKELVLSDVVKNTDLLVSCMEEQASDYYKDSIQTTVADFVAANGIDSLSWVMDYNGLTVTFNTYDLSMYAAGPFAADLTFKDYPDLFDAKWAEAPDDYAVLLCSGTNATGASFDLGNDGTAETYDFNTLITEVLPEFFGSYDEQYVHDDNLTNAVFDGTIELTAVYGVKVGGNYYICVFALLPDLEGGDPIPGFGTFKASGDGYEMTGIYTGEPVTLDEQITDPSLFYVTDEEGGSVPAYISADGELCLN